MPSCALLHLDMSNTDTIALRCCLAGFGVFFSDSNSWTVPAEVPLPVDQIPSDVNVQVLQCPAGNTVSDVWGLHDCVQSCLACQCWYDNDVQAICALSDKAVDKKWGVQKTVV